MNRESHIVQKPLRPPPSMLKQKAMAFALQNLQGSDMKSSIQSSTPPPPNITYSQSRSLKDPRLNRQGVNRTTDPSIHEVNIPETRISDTDQILDRNTYLYNQPRKDDLGRNLSGAIDHRLNYKEEFRPPDVVVPTQQRRDRRDISEKVDYYNPGFQFEASRSGSYGCQSQIGNQSVCDGRKNVSDGHRENNEDIRTVKNYNDIADVEGKFSDDEETFASSSIPPPPPFLAPETIQESLRQFSESNLLNSLPESVSPKKFQSSDSPTKKMSNSRDVFKDREEAFLRYSGCERQSSPEAHSFLSARYSPSSTPLLESSSPPQSLDSFLLSSSINQKQSEPSLRGNEEESLERLKSFNSYKNMSSESSFNPQINSGSRTTPAPQPKLFQPSNPLLDFFGIKFKPIESLSIGPSDSKSTIEIRNDIFANSGSNLMSRPEATPYVVYDNRNEDTLLRCSTLQNNINSTNIGVNVAGFEKIPEESQPQILSAPPPVIKLDSPEIKMDEKGMMRCNFCSSPGSIRIEDKFVHMDFHKTLQFVCAACPKNREFEDFPQIVEHVNSSHNVMDSEMVLETIILPTKLGALRVYKCGVTNCGKEFIGLQETDLKDHMSRAHGDYYIKVGRGKYVLRLCRICGDEESFTSQAELDLHIETCHPTQQFGSAIDISDESDTENMTDNLLDNLNKPRDKLIVEARTSHEIPVFGRPLTANVPEVSGFGRPLETGPDNPVFGRVIPEDLAVFGKPLLGDSERSSDIEEKEEGELRDTDTETVLDTRKKRRKEKKKRKGRLDPERKSDSKEESDISTRENSPIPEIKIKKEKPDSKKRKTGSIPKSLKEEVLQMTPREIKRYLKRIKHKVKKTKKKKDGKGENFPESIRGEKAVYYCKICNEHVGSLKKWLEHRKGLGHIETFDITSEEVKKKFNRPEIDLQEFIISNQRLDFIPSGQCKDCFKIFDHEKGFKNHMKTGKCPTISNDSEHLKSEKGDKSLCNRFKVEGLTNKRKSSISRSRSPKGQSHSLDSQQRKQQTSSATPMYKYRNKIKDSRCIEVVSVMLPKYMMNGKQAYYFCNMCQIPIGTIIHWAAHKDTKEHRENHQSCLKSSQGVKVVEFSVSSIICSKNYRNYCLACDSYLPDMPSFTKHLSEEKHKEQEIRKEIKDGNELRQGGERFLSIYYCDLCEKVFDENPMEHKLSDRHLILVEETEQCYFCSKRYIPGMLVAHIDEYHVNHVFKCTNCSVKFISVSKMLKHVRDHLTSVQRDSCTDKEVLSMDMVDIPDDLRKIMCRRCDKACFLAQDSSEAKLHVLNDHLDVLKTQVPSSLVYGCRVCDVDLKTEIEMDNHIKLHRMEMCEGRRSVKTIYKEASLSPVILKHDDMYHVGRSARSRTRSEDRYAKTRGKDYRIVEQSRKLSPQFKDKRSSSPQKRRLSNRKDYFSQTHHSPDRHSRRLDHSLDTHRSDVEHYVGSYRDNSWAKDLPRKYQERDSAHREEKSRKHDSGYLEHEHAILWENEYVREDCYRDGPATRRNKQSSGSNSKNYHEDTNRNRYQKGNRSQSLKDHTESSQKPSRIQSPSAVPSREVRLVSRSRTRSKSRSRSPNKPSPKSNSGLKDAIQKKIREQLEKNQTEETLKKDDVYDPKPNISVKKRLGAFNRNKLTVESSVDNCNSSIVHTQVEPMLKSLREHCDKKQKNAEKEEVKNKKLAESQLLNRLKRKANDEDLRKVIEEKKVKMLDSRPEGVKEEKIHAEDASDICPVCWKLFPGINNLLNHMKISHRSSMFGCNLCQALGWSSEILLKHLTDTHDRNIALPDALQHHIKIPDKLDRINCKLCLPPYQLGVEGFWLCSDLQATSNLQIEKHFIDIHGISDQVQIHSKLELTCRICCINFSVGQRAQWCKHILSDHTKLEKAGIRCEYCGESVLESERGWHLENKHAKDVFLCRICSAADTACFPSADSLKEIMQHMVMKHGNQYESFYDHMTYPVDLYRTCCSVGDCGSNGKYLSADPLLVQTHISENHSELVSPPNIVYLCRCCDKPDLKFENVEGVAAHIAKRHKQILKWKLENGNN